MKNIYVLSTDKPSRLFKTKSVLVFDRVKKVYSENFKKWGEYINQHIYITSDEEIKDNDYITDGYLVWKWKDDSSLLGRKKIILTTDVDLVDDGVQSIDDEFLEWFVKNPSCEEVEVEKEKINLGYISGTTYVDFTYKIIIPKEEPKQETLEEAFEKWADQQSEKGVGYDKYDVLRFGAEWQKEQFGKSEFLQKLRATISDAEARRLIFETFKKK